MKRKLITIMFSLMLLTKPITVYASEDTLPKVGVYEVLEITEDQAKWAYSKELGKQQLESEELRLMSAIIWCEAGNQCDAGKQAVGIVVMNRVDNESFENTVEDVIYEPGQFRPKTDGRLSKALIMYDNNEIPQECIDAAKYALSGNTIVNYNGQDIDMSEYLYFATNWANEKIRIQDHDFK